MGSVDHLRRISQQRPGVQQDLPELIRLRQKAVMRHIEHHVFKQIVCRLLDPGGDSALDPVAHAGVGISARQGARAPLAEQLGHVEASARARLNAAVKRLGRQLRTPLYRHGLNGVHRHARAEAIAFQHLPCRARVFGSHRGQMGGEYLMVPKRLGLQVGLRVHRQSAGSHGGKRLRWGRAAGDHQRIANGQVQRARSDPRALPRIAWRGCGQLRAVGEADGARRQCGITWQTWRAARRPGRVRPVASASGGRVGRAGSRWDDGVGFAVGGLLRGIGAGWAAVRTDRRHWHCHICSANWPRLVVTGAKGTRGNRSPGRRSRPPDCCIRSVPLRVSALREGPAVAAGPRIIRMSPSYSGRR
jgi:hypothetical protein